MRLTINLPQSIILPVVYLRISYLCSILSYNVLWNYYDPQPLFLNWEFSDLEHEDAFRFLPLINIQCLLMKLLLGAVKFNEQCFLCSSMTTFEKQRLYINELSRGEFNTCDALVLLQHVPWF